ncbi:MAG: hypothetical protein PHQ04_12325 [Opitutaceae bacterium]|nr:hypothetical protein [Opitutaceae bacterium]
MADVFGVSVVAMVAGEAAALGGALHAAWCDSLSRGEKTDLVTLTNRSVAVSESTRCAPDRNRHALYSKAQVRYERLCQVLRPTFG